MPHASRTPALRRRLVSPLSRRISFRWVGRHEFDALLDPFCKRQIGSDACRVDAHKAGECPACKFHRSHVPLSECPFTRLGPDSNHQIVVGDSASYASVHDEGQPSDHPLLSDFVPPGEHPPHALDQPLVVGHRSTPQNSTRLPPTRSQRRDAAFVARTSINFWKLVSQSTGWRVTSASESA